MRCIDDKLLCVISSCEDALDSNRLVYYMYTFQMAGYNFNFRYKLTSNGLRSRSLNNYIDELQDMEYLRDGDGILRATDKAIKEIGSYIMSLDHIEQHDFILDNLKKLTLDDLQFLVITDMAINEVRKKYGVDGLVLSKGYMQDIISKLSKEYSEENLNGAVALIKRIKRGQL